MMAALAWVDPEQDAGTVSARERLIQLRSAGEAAAGTTLEWKGPRKPERDRFSFAGVGCVVVAVALLACVVVGATTIVRWVVGMVAG